MSMDWNIYESVKELVARSCPTLCDPMDCSPRDWTQVSGIAGRFFTVWATRWLWNSFYLFIYLNWRIITHCDGFCHKSTWIDHRHTCVPSTLSPPHHPASVIMASFLFFFCYFQPNSYHIEKTLISLHLCLLCFPACRIIGSIFLDSIHMC